jgi:excinuclease ABC subunit C
MAEGQAQAKLLRGLAEAFELDTPPRRIEVYDNSHIQGTNAVGAMIVAGPDGVREIQYRKFNIKAMSLTPGDDFGMMKEVLTRRFQRLLKEDPDRESRPWPDLLLIDGGAGQVSAPCGDHGRSGGGGRADHRRGQGHRPRPGQGGVLPPRTQRLCAAVATTRCSISSSACATRRTGSPSARIARNGPRRSRATPLDDIPGVGATRKRALLAHFGSAKAVSRANLADLKGGGRGQRRSGAEDLRLLPRTPRGSTGQRGRHVADHLP